MKCMSTHGQSGVISKSQNGVLTVPSLCYTSDKHPGGGGATLNVEVIGMLVGNFFGKP